jgi:hypothetical protein
VSGSYVATTLDTRTLLVLVSCLSRSVGSSQTLELNKNYICSPGSTSSTNFCPTIHSPGRPTTRPKYVGRNSSRGNNDCCLHQPRTEFSRQPIQHQVVAVYIKQSEQYTLFLHNSIHSLRTRDSHKKPRIPPHSIISKPTLEIQVT